MTAALIIFLTLFTSCTTEVTLTVQKDDSVDIRFEGGAGESFAKLFGEIDVDSVSYELAKAGFSDVKVTQKNGGNVLISMSDKKQSSYIFTSKIIRSEKGKLSAAISRKSLEDFYTASDEQTRSILDLFLAPVFNDEEMTESEYIEMVGSFYGDASAQEIAGSFIKINLISKDGTKETLSIPLAQLLCGNFNY